MGDVKSPLTASAAKPGVEAPVQTTQFVRPEKINLHVVGGDHGQWLAAREGDSMDGDWDLQVRDLHFTELMPYRALAQHFADGRAWEDTEYVDYCRRRVQRDVEMGRLPADAVEPEVRDRLGRLDSIFDDMSSAGYRSQAEVEERMRRLDDEIKVAISREGRYIFVDGRHRLSMARILGQPRVPVEVVARHAQWDAFRDHVLREGNMGGRIYHTVDHPDLESIPAHHYHDRVELLRDALQTEAVQGKRLLDVGANWGYFSQQMTDMGFRVTAVEAIPKDAEIIRRIARATETEFDVWQGDIVNHPDIEQFEVVLLLNVLHHFLKTSERFASLPGLLRRLRAEIVIFEPNKARMGNAVSDLFGEEFTAWVAERAGYTDVRLLGRAADKRPVYALRR